LIGMAANGTLLCIHRDPAQLSLLEENGYELVTATNGHDGLRLFMARSVDAIVLEYPLGLLDGSVIAAEIKQVRPKLPIIMLVDHAELPEGALKSVDVLVSTSDPPHFLWAAVHFVLNVKLDRSRQGKTRAQTPARLRRPGRSRERAESWQATAAQLAADEQDAPFSRGVWRSILNGTVRF
jgi:DNA-binding NtrC family response regulator